MFTLEDYIEEQKKKDPKFAKNFEEGYLEFKIGLMIKEARKNAGLSQDQLAKKLNTKKEAISRIENHAKDARISTLIKIAKALGKGFDFSFIDSK